jgi:hypothetical protein
MESFAKTYTVTIESLIKLKASGVSYSIHLLPFGHSGFVPCRTYASREQLVTAMNRLGIDERAQRRIFRDMGSGRDVALTDIPLSDNVAAEFGSPDG